MPQFNISKQEIERSKEIIKRFDAQKVYDKLDCQNNWMGYLGEYKFRQYLISEDIMCIWNEFVKDDYTKPDFLVKNTTIDVKCVFCGENLWVQSAIWDLYVLSIINKEQNELSIVGFIRKKDLIKLMKSKKYRVIRGSRIDYAIPISRLSPMNEFKKALEE